MDTNVTTTSYTLDDNDSIASAKGTTTARTAKIDMATFDQSMYPTGILPKGTVLAKRTSDGLYCAYQSSGSGGLATAVGVLASSIRVSVAGATVTTKVFGALQWEGVYKVASAPHGNTLTHKGAMDSTAQTALAPHWYFI